VAMLVPVMIPMVVAVAAKLYSYTVWVSPLVLLNQIVTKQLLPLAVGVTIAYIAPRIRERYQITLNVLGNSLLTILIGLILFKMGPALKAITPMLPIVALLLAAGSMGAIWLIGLGDPVTKQTFAICNANRHVGLALLLSGQYLHATRAVPAIACYALIAPVAMFAYAWWYRGGWRGQKSPFPNSR
jgi:bile acid:Na+ symporter, BASS family